MTKQSNTTSFNENYKKIKEIAEKLRSQTEPDIDALIPMIEAASQSYQLCKERLKSVEQALKEHFPSEEEPHKDLEES